MIQIIINIRIQIFKKIQICMIVNTAVWDLTIGPLYEHSISIYTRNDTLTIPFWHNTPRFYHIHKICHSSIDANGGIHWSVRELLNVLHMLNPNATHGQTSSDSSITSS